MSDSSRPHWRSPPGSPVPGILQARTLEWAAITFSNAWKWKVNVKLLSRVLLLVTPWTAAHQAPPCMGFSRQEYWSGVPLDGSPTYTEQNSWQKNRQHTAAASRIRQWSWLRGVRKNALPFWAHHTEHITPSTSHRSQTMSPRNWERYIASPRELRPWHWKMWADLCGSHKTHTHTQMKRQALTLNWEKKKKKQLKTLKETTENKTLSSSSYGPQIIRQRHIFRTLHI